MWFFITVMMMILKRLISTIDTLQRRWEWNFLAINSGMNRISCFNFLGIPVSLYTKTFNSVQFTSFTCKIFLATIFESICLAVFLTIRLSCLSSFLGITIRFFIAIFAFFTKSSISIFSTFTSIEICNWFDLFALRASFCYDFINHICSPKQVWLEPVLGYTPNIGLFYGITSGGICQ